ncbi:Self-incomp_S1 domain-containing protein [Cephalotus follicularis]|uniref:S-protein homolog n=1 Tax=Cephalotus follicularis TaxID=3775 RepID=A0A1Q3BRP3_CEPFO|nr:Self-incomp_S1 domain-containing protein [Cephalotus follicularis]
MLHIECKSKDNDLGMHNLSPGANFTWSFRENFFQRTLFWCHAIKDATFKVFWLDAFLFYKCMWKRCIYVAKDDGISIKDLHKKLDELLQKWESGPQTDGAYS